MDEYVVNDYHGANDPPVAHYKAAVLPTIKITPVNADSRIRDAVEVLIRLWDEWDANAQQEAQKTQNPEAWFEEMTDQVGAVLTGMVCDDCHWCGGTGVVDSGGIDESGRWINVPCSECCPKECYRTFDCNGGDHSDACPAGERQP